LSVKPTIILLTKATGGPEPSLTNQPIFCADLLHDGMVDEGSLCGETDHRIRSVAQRISACLPEGMGKQKQKRRKQTLSGTTQTSATDSDKAPCPRSQAANPWQIETQEIDRIKRTDSRKLADRWAEL
jgi:hypothetical protein